MDDAGSDGGDDGNTDSNKDNNEDNNTGNNDTDNNDAGSIHHADTFQIVCRPFKRSLP
jgi:hypothetical protein